MWSFGSKSSLQCAVWVSIALWAAVAAAFYYAQNTLKPIGGDVSLAKTFWLAGAVLLWGILPLFLLADWRLGAWLRRTFAALAALMFARGVIEGWMLYVTFTWSPWYGIAHDLACAALLAWFGARAATPTPLDRAVRNHAWVTAAFFGPEIYFAWYMQAHFDTTGGAAIYFVPENPIYDDVLSVTKVVVVCLFLYLPVFLYRWIHGFKHETAWADLAPPSDRAGK